MPVVTTTLIERFEAKFVKSNGCWNWTAVKNNTGYGQFSVNRRMKLAHRFSYETYVGSLGEDMHVCHRCDNPACVNPDHLFLGTHKDNMQDRDQKGRQSDKRGSRNGQSKLSENDIIKIRTEAGTNTSIASAYGVSMQLISRIRRNEAWRHI